MRDKLLLMGLTLVLLTACIGGSRPQDIDYHKGTRGVTIEFMDQAPPPEIYEGSQFSARVMIHNEGAQDLPMGAVAIGGNDLVDLRLPGMLSLSYDSFYVEEDEQLTPEGLEEELQNVTVLGRSEIVPDGEEDTMTLGYLKARPIAGQRESPETQIYASLCYPYRTVLSTDICMDSTQQQTNLREQVCTARDKSLTGGQGAPVTITRVEVDMVPLGSLTRPSFRIHVENTGSGNVLRSFGNYENIEDVCSYRDTDRQGQGTISVFADLAGVELECQPDPVKLVTGENTFFCIVPSEALSENRNLFARQDNFVTTLNVELGYYYATSASKTIEIQRTAGNLIGDQYQEQGGGCLPWETEQSGECVNSCGVENEGFSCSCTVGEAGDLPPDRVIQGGGQYCPSGVVCCQKTACEDFDNDRNDCLEAGLGCSYCESDDTCRAEGCPEAEDES